MKVRIHFFTLAAMIGFSSVTWASENPCETIQNFDGRPQARAHEPIRPIALCQVVEDADVRGGLPIRLIEANFCLAEINNHMRRPGARDFILYGVGATQTASNGFTVRSRYAWTSRKVVDIYPDSEVYQRSDSRGVEFRRYIEGHTARSSSAQRGTVRWDREKAQLSFEILERTSGLFGSWRPWRRYVHATLSCVEMK